MEITAHTMLRTLDGITETSTPEELMAWLAVQKDEVAIALHKAAKEPFAQADAAGRAVIISGAIAALDAAREKSYLASLR